MAAISNIYSNTDRQTAYMTLLFAYLVSHKDLANIRNNTYAILPTSTGDWRHTPIDDTTARFIKLEQSFIQQYEAHPEYLGNQSEYCVKEKMKMSAELLLHCNPDVITLQVTGEGSLYYTVCKNDTTFYLQHYLIDEFDGTDEAIVTVYKDNNRILEYGGSLVETIQQITMILPESITFPLPELA